MEKDDSPRLIKCPHCGVYNIKMRCINCGQEIKNPYAGETIKNEPEDESA